MAIHINPFSSSKSYFFVLHILVSSLYNVKILNTEAIATSDDGTGVMRLENVFHYESEVLSSVINYLFELLPSFFSDELS
jgi:hypothetical protein